MRKSIEICALICLILTLNGFANTLVVTDTQDSKNWGDWFLPDGMEPKSGSPPKYLPYYRWDDNDWGWSHTLAFEKSPAEIISATLEIEAYDVDISDVHQIYGDGIYIGKLEPSPGQTPTMNNDGYDAPWSITQFVLEPDVLAALMDGSIDIWMDIDATNTSGPGEGCLAVTLRRSSLVAFYSTDLSDDPNKPISDPNLPEDKPKTPPDKPKTPPDDNVPPVDPNEPSEGPKTYLLTPVDLSLPTINDPGDGIAQIGGEQAWFAFDLSGIPDEEHIVSASFMADMMDFDGIPTQRTLWYHSDDSWIDTSIPNLSDPGNAPADGQIVGTVTHNSMSYELATIDITHDWSNDIADDYITLMLTGPLGGSYSSGAVNLLTAELEIVTLASGWIDNDSKIINLGPEELVQVDGLDITVPGYSVPSVFDWNNDGLQDLIIGEGGGFGDAKVSLYLNIGTESNPRFSDNYIFYAQVLDQSSLSDLTCPASGCLGCFPRVLYWDADLLKDMIVGQADGTVKIFLNIWTDGYPIFDTGTFLGVGKSGLKNDINVGARATPSVVDWNNDGRKDLVVGALDGRIHVFINEGTDTEPDFVFDSFAQENDAELVVPSGRSSPEVFDLDFDGRKDIITGNTDGQLLFYRNVGTNKTPEFSGYTLVESDNIPIDLPDMPRSRPFIGYWSLDDYPDILIGAGDGKVHLFQGLPLLDDMVLNSDLAW